MATIQCFEDIEAWKLARSLTRAIYATTRAGELARDYGLRDQMRRAATSIMANIAEGFDRGGDAEFKQFLSIAKGSTSELQSHLYVALDAGFITQTDFEALHNLARDTNALIGGFMRYLSSSDMKGRKHRT